jgi:hypothetical protein
MKLIIIMIVMHSYVDVYNYHCHHIHNTQQKNVLKNTSHLNK